MPNILNLFLSPSPSAAAQHLRGQIEALRQAQPYLPITILAPTTAVIDHLRTQLPAVMGVRLTPFYRFAGKLLSAAGSPVRELNDFAIRALLRALLDELHAEGELTTFAPLREAPGMREVLLDWLREMKSQGIWPEDYAAHARASADPRDLQLAALYTRYQRFLIEKGCSDADGLLWLAAESLEKGEVPVAGALFVTGFDQFTTVQRRILEQLSVRCDPFGLYLLWDSTQPDDGIALARLRETRAFLNESITFYEEILPGQAPPAAALAHLQGTLFRLDASPAPAGEAVQLIEAPSREQELRAALRRVKALLQAGTPAGQIAVLTPNPPAYQPIAAAVAAEFGLPLQVETSLVENPAAAALANLLGLSPDFPWLETLDALRSPYVRQPWLSPEQIDRIDRLSREKPVAGGRDQWLFALQPVAPPAEHAEEEDRSPAMQAGLLPEDDLAAMAAGLGAFFDHLTPPETGSYAAYACWVQTALLGLEEQTGGVTPPGPGKEGMEGEAGGRQTPGPGKEDMEGEAGSGQKPEPIGQVNNGTSQDPADRTPTPSLYLLQASLEGPYAPRDLEALRLFHRALGQLSAAAALPGGDEEVTWSQYRDTLLGALAVLRLPAASGSGGVRFEPLEGGRAYPVEHLFVLGLSEGEFPRPPAPDVFYAPAERRDHPLALIRYNPLHAATLWWQVLRSCTGRLTLLRPYIDDNGAPWEPSPYWEAAAGCFSGLQPERIPIAALPDLHQAASANELLIALAQGNTAQAPAALQPAWQFACQADGMMRQRSGSAPPGNHEGVLASAEIRSELAERFGPDFRWSPSRLNRYAACPYGFFAEYVLGLEPLVDPQEGFDALQRGSLLHAVLEQTFRRLVESGIQLVPENFPQVQDCLEQACQAEFAVAPLRYGFRPGALWRYEQAELRRMLGVLLEWECDQPGNSAAAGSAGYQPWLQEVKFGLPEGYPMLALQVGDISFRVAGVIDRIDRGEGGALRVIDYKSGSSAYSAADITSGAALQTVFYALAAEQCLGSGGEAGEGFGQQSPHNGSSQHVVGADINGQFSGNGSSRRLAGGVRVAESAYLHIPTRKFSGKLTLQGLASEHEAIQEALFQAARHIRSVRAGVFLSAPVKPADGASACRLHCEFAPMCRVTRESIRKARRGGTHAADA